MSLTHDQAMSFYAALIDSKPMGVHFEAILGFGKAPSKVTDFESNNAKTLERCEEMMNHVTECTELLMEQIRTRPRQAELDLDGGEKGGTE